jgi:hypothetical protein
MTQISGVPLTFDVIGETTSAREVAEEWRGGVQGLRAGSTDHSENLPADLNRLVFSFKELRRETSASTVSAFSQSVEHQLSAKSVVLGEAISDIASMESNLDRLLAARGELAVDILEALQMVRFLSSRSLS